MQKGKHFQLHQYWDGEETLVLEGIFSDEHGDYPKDAWIRSPHLSIQQSYTDEGTLIFVKVGHIPE